MRQAIATLVLVLLSAAAPDPRKELVGHWVGTSTCDKVVAPACNDEKASYHVRRGYAPDVVVIDFAKIVDGKDELMGTSNCKVDFPRHTVDCTTTNRRGENLEWTFAWKGRDMTGTLKMPDGRVARNIHVVRQ